MKKFLAVLFALGIVCLIYAVYDYGLIDMDLFVSNTTVIHETVEIETPDGVKTFDEISKKYEDAIKKIETGYQNQFDNIRLKSCRITVDELEEIVKYLKTNCFYYYVDSNYTYFSDGQYITSINPRYTMSAEEIKETDRFIHSMIDDIAKQASSYKTDIEKLIFIHNYLVENLEYGNDDSSENNIYGALVLKKTKCVGYSEAFRYIAEKAGIKTYIVSSSKLAHAWNMVLINGNYFFVDCTWDDPILDKVNLSNDPLSGYGCYKYFLCSEANYMKNEHKATDWTVNGENIKGIAVTTAYDNFLWRDYGSLMRYSKGSWYHDYGYSGENITNSNDVKFSIDKITFSGNTKYEQETVRTIRTCWKMGMEFYDAFESTLQCIEDDLYYFTAEGIYRLDEKGRLNGKKDLRVFKNPKFNNIYDFDIDVLNGKFTVMYGSTDAYTKNNAAKETYKIADYFCKAGDHLYSVDKEKSNQNEKVYKCIFCQKTTNETE
ncbi:MAG: hypothetical protein K2I73_07650 [Eubacterium sp.]|nr:hypothetical protein [Eubacterium sp.]